MSPLPTNECDERPVGVYALSRDVVSCASAAAAKRVPLGRELKTLFLSAHGGPYDTVMVHVPGDSQVDLSAVAAAIGARSVRLASRDVLTHFDCEPGTVTPFAHAVRDLPHIVDPEVLRRDWMTTNAGTLRTYRVFVPQDLMALSNVTIHQVSER